jgi:predicted sulfurtransferase
MTAVEVVEVVSHISSKKSTLSENCGPSSEEGSPKEVVTVECGSSSWSVNSHDLWKIALYYIYIEMTPAQVESHVDAQRQVCEELGLMGRIRVSKEGVNGVLSGKYEVLRVYEKTIAGALQEIAGEKEREKRKLQGGRILMENTNTTENNNKDDDEDDDEIIRIDLDIKFCELRTELPIQKQLFDRLIVKETKNVIGLFDQSHQQDQQRQQQKSSKSEKYRRRRERKRQEQEAKRKTNAEHQHQQSQPTQAQQSLLSAEISTTPTNDEKIILADKDGDEALGNQHIPPSPASPASPRPLDMSSLYRSVMEEPLKSARHLSATEWNEKLDAVASSEKSALLLDVRNVYEMKVGHFAHPSTPTLLTNTRKYSDLPQMLASNQEMQERDQIFMYCTGGVRCERVSMLVHELYPEKEIFQLQGGIQRYLETCSEQQNQQLKEEDGTGTIDSTENNPSYFVGKNFVSVDYYLYCLRYTRSVETLYEKYPILSSLVVWHNL